MPPATPSADDLLTRGVVEVIDAKHLAFKLRGSRPLRVKLGIDPTSHELHLGHAVALRKLRAFQRAGHRAVLIIGDYTARIGDPSGRDKTRLALSADQVQRYAETYLEQVGRIIDLKRTEVRRNSEWFDDFTVADIVKLLGQTTVKQLLAHEGFRQRLEADRPLSLHELLYPLLQGYDSVAVEADVELGGLDQRFNLLTGRDIQRAYGQESQDVVLMDYLLGVDGRAKMSKTLKNTIALTDPPEEMYGKIMSIPDKLIAPYFALAADAPAAEVAEVKRGLRNKKTNPRDLKMRLAERVVELYYGSAEAQRSAGEFSRVFRRKEAPAKMDTAAVRPGRHALINLLVSQRLVASRSEARRLIEQGGIRVNHQVVNDWEASVDVVDGTILQVGKRRFVRLTIES